MSASGRHLGCVRRLRPHTPCPVQAVALTPMMHVVSLASVGLVMHVPGLQPRAPMPAAWTDAPLLPPAPAGSSRAPLCDLTMALMEAPTRPTPVRSNAVTRRGGGQLISWYFNSISSTRLLSAEQERQLASMIIAGDEYDRMKEELAEELGRKPELEEWAEKAQLDKRELRKRMRRANSARDLMVAANSERPRPRPISPQLIPHRSPPPLSLPASGSWRARQPIALPPPRR